MLCIQHFHMLFFSGNYCHDNIYVISFFGITFKAWLYLTFVTLPFKYLNAVFKRLDTTHFSLQSRKPDKGCYEK